MDLCLFPRHGEFVYAFLNPLFTCLSLRVQEAALGAHYSFHVYTACRLPLHPLKMINLLLVFAVYLLLICFYLTKQNEPLGDMC